MRRGAWIGALVLGLPAFAGGQSPCTPATTGWQPPLDRRVQVAPGLSVREALDAVGRETGISITYSTDLLPRALARCASDGAIPLGDALTSWLSSSTLAPVVVAGARVVLVPGRTVAPPPEAAPLAMMPAPAVLAPVVVQESRPPAARVPASVAQTVIDREDIRASGAASMAQLLNTHVPGLWIWTPSPSSLGASVASLRGASSFGASQPKVYIDGIEVANPLFLAQLSPDQVARIEVIRGPQGAALYGAGAVSGVLRITTRQAGEHGEPDHLAIRSAAGMSGSAFTPLGSLVQEHALSGRLGREDRSLGIGLLTATTGAFVPGAFSRQMQATVGATVLGARSRWQVTARGASQAVGNAMSPLLGARPLTDVMAHDGDRPSMAPMVRAAAAPMWDSTRAQSVREYTVGSTLALDGARWSHEFVAGLDGYRLDNVALQPGQLRSPGDSALLAAIGAGDRLSLRWNGSTWRRGPAGSFALVTFGVEQSSLRDASRGVQYAPVSVGDAPIWRHTTAVMGHTELRLPGRVVVNAGLRGERNAGFTLLSGVAALPTLGAAWQTDAGPVGITLRGTYGRAIQPPRVGSWANPWGGRSPSILAVEPEQQEGVELGAELRLGARASLGITRYDQRASNLLQPVPAPGAGGRGTTLRLDNVGAIANRGWEFEGRLSRGNLNLTGSLGLTDSRVARLAQGYRGDLRVDDRLLQVPRTTMGAAAHWLGRGWSSTVSVARASDWVNYDWLALAAAPHAPRAEELRAYWLDYPGITRVGATFTRTLFATLELVATGENLLGQQRGEPDNVTIVPGRTLRGGVRARF